MAIKQAPYFKLKLHLFNYKNKFHDPNLKQNK